METKQLSDKWLKAAVIGGLWASIEIVLGSFLHNLRIPFAGTILATQGILILIAFIQVWKESGIIIRAGIITALMKSISPSSVILGPMIGILMEAAILEFFLLLFGRGIIGTILGSSFALASALIHKAFSIIILYGWSIVKIYENIYVYFQKILNLGSLKPFEFILLILMIYLVFGAFAGILGISIGKRAKALLPKTKANEIADAKQEIFPLGGSQKYNLYQLAINLLLIPIGLILINKNLFYYGFPFLLVFTAYAYSNYKAIFRRLKKPIFWGQLIVIILLSGFFYSNGDKTTDVFHLSGLYFGLEMSFRAIFIVMAFTTISIELRNPDIKKFLYAHQLGALHGSLSLAFNSLPIIVKSLPPIKHFFRHPLSTFSLLVASNINWYTVFKNLNKS